MLYLQYLQYGWSIKSLYEGVNILHINIDLPWELRQVISYCARDRFYCTVYLASAFHLIRTNAQGLQTYARPLRGLMPHEKEEIRQSSMVSEWARSHRAEREFEATMTSHPVLRRAEGPGEERAA